MTRQTRWTDNELATLRRMRAAGQTQQQIADALGRTLNSVKGRVQVEDGTVVLRRSYQRKAQRQKIEIAAIMPRAVLEQMDRIEPTPEQLAEREARLNAPYRGFTGAFFQDPRYGYSALDRRRA